MPGSSSTLHALRQLLAERFPPAPRGGGGVVPTGIEPIDRALNGGLRAGALTEIVSAGPSSGGQSVLGGLLAATRQARSRLALIDGTDAFDPAGVPPDCLRHLLWVRCEKPEQAFAAADILVRDGNYAAVVLDLRGVAERTLRRTPASVWYRLQRAAENGAAAVLVQTEFPVVPAVPWRLRLERSLPLEVEIRVRTEVMGRIEVASERGSSKVPSEVEGEGLASSGRRQEAASRRFHLPPAEPDGLQLAG